MSEVRPRRTPALSILIGLMGLLAFLPLAQAQSLAPSPLPALGLDVKSVSVSGLSSGGYMASQFEVAYARDIMGAGIVAAGPYGCSMGSATTAALTCTCPYDIVDHSGPLGVMSAVSRQHCMQLPERIMADRALAAVRANAGHVDGLAPMKRHRVWLYAGHNDPVVAPTTVQGLARFYAQAKVQAVKTVAGTRAGHGMPIARSDASCETTRSPFLNGCQLDGAGEMLRWIYRLPASTRPAAPEPGSLKPFDQKPYRQTAVFDGLDDTGWLYVPKACEKARAHCKLHVVFHGCEQSQRSLLDGAQAQGLQFVEQAGYNPWAERMGMVVLYPQVRPSDRNPKGCWDFWGYTTPADEPSSASTGLPFGRRDAPQMQAVKAMVAALLAKTPPSTD